MAVSGRQTILCHTETSHAQVSVLNTLLSAPLTLKEPDTLGISDEPISLQFNKPTHFKSLILEHDSCQKRGTFSKIIRTFILIALSNTENPKLKVGA